jgi:phage-related protein
MDFTVEFYETRNGRCPVREFLEQLRRSDPGDHAALQSPRRGPFELRHVGKLNTRVLWFFVKGRRIITVHGIRNKGQAIPALELDIARTRMRDWRERSEE